MESGVTTSMSVKCSDLASTESLASTSLLDSDVDRVLQDMLVEPFKGSDLKLLDPIDR